MGDISIESRHDEVFPVEVLNDLETPILSGRKPKSWRRPSSPEARAPRELGWRAAGSSWRKLSTITQD
jgi:hypothetical protein